MLTCISDLQIDYVSSVNKIDFFKNPVWRKALVVGSLFIRFQAPLNAQHQIFLLFNTDDVNETGYS